MINIKDIIHGITTLTGEFNPTKHLNKIPEYKINSQFELDNIIYKHIQINVDNNDELSAYILYPKKHKNKVPGILALHQTTTPKTIGSKEPAGLLGNLNFAYAKELTREGYVTIAPDYPLFGLYDIKESTIYDKYEYESMTMKAIINHIASVNVLSSLDNVNADLIGCIGHSLGGTNSLFSAFFDKRIKALAISAGITTFSAYAMSSKTHNLVKWARRDKYMPNIELLFNNNTELMPFDFPDLLSSLFPTPVFISAPKKDEIFSFEGAINCINKANKEYQLNGHSENFEYVTPNCGHDFPEFVRKECYAFFKKHLRI